MEPETLDRGTMTRMYFKLRMIARDKSTAWIAAFFLVMASLSASETRVDSILATVNGNPITLLDVVLETGRQEVRLGSVYKGNELEEEIRKLRKQVIEEIVNRKLIVEDYRIYNFAIPRQFIEDNLQGLAAHVADGTMNGLRRKAESFGTSLEELREKAREKVIMDIMIHEFCVRPVEITPEETYRHYQENIGRYHREAELSVQAILLRSDGKYGESVGKVANEITVKLSEDREETFIRLVRLYSEGPNAELDGDIGTVKESQLRQDFATALKGKSAGSVAGPIKTPEGVYFLRIRERKAETVTPFSEIKDKIERNLQEQRKQERYEEYMGRLKQDAVIRYLF
jgi:hypothetical protein